MEGRHDRLYRYVKSILISLFFLSSSVVFWNEMSLLYSIA
jgi:hypothetical protein